MLSQLPTFWTILPIAAAMANLLAMAMVLMRTTNRGVARSFMLAAVSLVAWDLQLPLDSTLGLAGTHTIWVHVVRSVAMLTPAAIFHTAFECAGGCERGCPRPVWIGYGISAFLATLQTQGLVFSGFVLYSWGAVPRPGLLFPVAAAFAVVWMGLGVLYCIRALRQPVSPQIRLRAKYWLLGAATALPIGMTQVLAHYGWPVLPIWSSGSFCIIGLIAYAAVRRRLLDFDVFITKAVAVLLTVIVVALPVFAVTASTVHSALNVFDCLALGFLTLAGIFATLVFPGVRAHIERGIERLLFPTRRAAREAICQFSLDVVKLPCRADLGAQVVRTLQDGLQLKGAAFYLRANDTEDFCLVASEGEIDSPSQVRGGDWLSTQGPPTDDAPLLRLGSQSDAIGNCLGNLDWEGCVPVWSERSCLALIGLGAKRSGANFNDGDSALLTVLSAQLAIGLKNAEYVHEIERQKTAIEELQRRLTAENVTLRAKVQSASQFKEIIGSSSALQRVLALVERAAPTDASILITGETGTGKELITRAIHDLSPRRHAPLICVNCSAIPRQLAESELFGHQRGAFTDAVADRPGSFEIAHGGTIFLDEVGDLPFELQAKLLRVLQERVVQRLGGQKLHRLDLRVVAATNRDLRAEMHAQRFREDLYYRLAAVVVELPPLRERIEDIPMLATYFLERAAATYQCTARGFTPDAMEALRRYSWPGNIRELQNVVERAALLCTSETIRPEHLSDVAAAPRLPFGRAIREEKRRRIERALAQTGGNQAAAARLLGITPSNLARTIKSVGAKFPSSLQ